MAWVKRGRRWIYVRDEAPRRKRKPAAAPKRKPTGVLSTAERAKASRTTRRRASTPGTREYRASNRRLRTRARELGIPTRGPLGRVPTTVLRSQVRSAERTRRQIARTTARSKRRSSTPGILRRGLIGSAIFELTGEDVSPSVRRALWGTENPSAGQLALGAIPGLGGARTAVRGASAVARGAGEALRGLGRAARTVDDVLSLRGLARIARGRRPAPPRASRHTARKTAQSRPRRALRVAGGVARAGARAAAFPILRPVKTAKYAALAQAPTALATGDPGGEFQKVLEGTGVASQVLGPVADAARESIPVAGNLVGDILNLPANIVPGVYLPAAALVEAAQGRPERLESMWRDYTEHGFLPRLVSGDLAGAGRAFAEHPLYSALEARGAQAVAGRTAGAALRRGVAGRRGRQIASQERAPLQMPGDLEDQPRQYSPDLIEKGVQVALDRLRQRRQGGQIATPREVNRIMAERVDTLASAAAGQQRINRDLEIAAAKDAARGLSRADLEGVPFAIRGLAGGSPDRFRAQLADHLRTVEEAGRAMEQRVRQAQNRTERKLAEAQLKENRKYRDVLERVIREGDPEKILRAARENAEALRRGTAQLEELGLLGEGQGAQAAAIPFAAQRMGARIDRSQETQARIDRQREASRLERRAPRLRERARAEQARVREIERQERSTPSRRERRLQANIKRERAQAVQQALRSDEQLVATERRVRELRRRERQRQREAAYLRGRLERLEREEQSRGKREAARKASESARKQATDLRARIAARQRQADHLRGRLERLEAEERARIKRGGVYKTGPKKGKPKRDVREITRRTRNALLGAEADLRGLRAELRAVERKAKVAEREARKRPVDPKKAAALTNRTRQKLLDAEADLRGLRAERRKLEGQAKKRARELTKAARAAEPPSARKLASARGRRRALGAPSQRLERRRAEAQRLAREAALAQARARAIRRAEPASIQALSRREQLVDAEGRALPTERIHAEMRRQGIDPEQVAFITERPGGHGRSAYWRAPLTRPSIARARRTGKATRSGLAGTGYERVVEQRVRNQQLIDSVRNFEHIIGNLAVLRNRWRTHQDAADVARNPEAYGLPPGEYMPIRLSPFSASRREQRLAEEAFDALDPGDTLAVENFAEQMVTRATDRSAPGPWVLVRKADYDRLRDHFRAADPGQRAAQLVSQTFKGVVLPLSTNWYLANFLDINMRAALEGTTPYGLNARLARRFLREFLRIDPDGARRFIANVTPGMQAGRAINDHYHRSADQFQGTRMELVANAISAVGNAPVVSQVVNAWRAFRNGAYRFENWFVESPGQQAILGKALREEFRRTNNSWRAGVRITDEALREFIQSGRLGTAKQIELAKRVERAMGQWSRNSPRARRWLVDYAPFGQWLRAAARFTYLTVPAHHPVKLGIATALMRMSEEQRKELGLDYFAERPVPPNLQGSIPLTGDVRIGFDSPLGFIGIAGEEGGILPVQQFTTFGQFAGPFTPQGLAGFLLPHLPIHELQGLDWTGARLSHADGTPLNQNEIAAAAFLALAEMFIPGASLAGRITGFDPLDTGRKPQGASAAIPRGLRPYDAGLVEWLRSQSRMRQIGVPVGPSSGAPPSSGSGSSSGSTINPYIGSGAPRSSGSGSSSGSTTNPYIGL